MTTTLLVPLALLLLPASGSSAAFGSESNAAFGRGSLAPMGTPEVRLELKELVLEEVQTAEERPVAELWSRAMMVRDAERLGEEGELDRVLDEFLAEEALGNHARLFLAAARLAGEDVDTALLSAALRQLIEAPDEVAQSAAGLLGDPIFRTLQSRKRDALVEDMLAAARDGSRTPQYRLAYAAATYAIGGLGERRDALKEMKAFFNSQDADLRALGALQLAATGSTLIEGRLRQELEQLARYPDERGALADSYLTQARRQELYDRKLRDARKSTEIPPELDEFNSVLDMIENLHLEGGNIEREELIDAAMDGMLRWMDPHSTYLSSEDFAAFFQDLEAEYGGIGAYVGPDPDNGLFTIVRPIYSGPAYAAGLKTDDKIVRIGDWPTIGQEVDDIIKKLKGKPGTAVKLYVWRRGMDPELIERPTEDMVVEIGRKQIEIPSGASQMLPGKLGMVELSTFSKKAMSDMRRDIQRMLDDGMRALILDLRNNSGGLLSQAKEVADLFLPRGKRVVSTEDRMRPPEHLETETPPLVPEGMPIVVLTNRYTASAAEIVSGALQDHERASLVGKRTFGKGSVQQLLPVDGARQDVWTDEDRDGLWDPWEKIEVDHDGDGEVDYAPRVKLTIARYRLPSGRSIHRELDKEGNLVQEGGVMPGVEVDTPTIERWEYEEVNRLRGEGAMQAYVDEHWDQYHELFGHLAVNDGKDPELYPEFGSFMAELATSLSRDTVRRLVRNEIRRRVQDDRGAEFPQGDFVEDVQLQKAIELALADLGEAPADIREFGLVFDVEGMNRKDSGRQDLAVLRPVDDDLARAQALIRAAREGGSGLNDEQLRQLEELLGDKKN